VDTLPSGIRSASDEAGEIILTLLLLILLCKICAGRPYRSHDFFNTTAAARRSTVVRLRAPKLLGLGLGGPSARASIKTNYHTFSIWQMVLFILYHANYYRTHILKNATCKTNVASSKFVVCHALTFNASHTSFTSAKRENLSTSLSLELNTAHYFLTGPPLYF